MSWTFQQRYRWDIYLIYFVCKYKSFCCCLTLGDVGFCVCQVVNEIYGESLSAELDDLPLHSNQYQMTEFAKKYFREAQRNKKLVPCTINIMHI